MFVLRGLFIVSYFNFMYFSYCQQIVEKDQIVFVPKAEVTVVYSSLSYSSIVVQELLHIRCPATVSAL